MLHNVERAYVRLTSNNAAERQQFSNRWHLSNKSPLNLLRVNTESTMDCMSYRVLSYVTKQKSPENILRLFHDPLDIVSASQSFRYFFNLCFYVEPAILSHQAFSCSFCSLHSNNLCLNKGCQSCVHLSSYFK
jgi:hypothetical protein